MHDHSAKVINNISSNQSVCLTEENKMQKYYRKIKLNKITDLQFIILQSCSMHKCDWGDHFCNLVHYKN